jgi:two-component SAPR family response regulator
MPKMNGFELYKKIKEIDNKIEACFITAFEDYREEFKESFPELKEAKYFIRKPKSYRRSSKTCSNNSRMNQETL